MWLLESASGCDAVQAHLTMACYALDLVSRGTASSETDPNYNALTYAFDVDEAGLYRLNMSVPSRDLLHVLLTQ